MRRNNWKAAVAPEIAATAVATSELRFPSMKVKPAARTSKTSTITPTSTRFQKKGKEKVVSTSIKYVIFFACFKNLRRALTTIAEVLSLKSKPKAIFLTDANLTATACSDSEPARVVLDPTEAPTETPLSFL